MVVTGLIPELVDLHRPHPPVLARAANNTKRISTAQPRPGRKCKHKECSCPRQDQENKGSWSSRDRCGENRLRAHIANHEGKAGTHHGCSKEITKEKSVRWCGINNGEGGGTLHSLAISMPPGSGIANPGRSPGRLLDCLQFHRP